MDKYVFLESEYRGMDMRSGWIHHNYYDACSGQAYYDFIDYAFSICDYFMLVYVNYCGKGFPKTMKAFRKALSPYRVKSRSNPSWPGTLMTYCANTIYRVIFYRAEEAAKEVLKRVSSISDWCRPAYPQDLAFFKGNICWFASTAHEHDAMVLHATPEDIAFLISNGLAKQENVKEMTEAQFAYYTQYNEQLEP